MDGLLVPLETICAAPQLDCLPSGFCRPAILGASTRVSRSSCCCSRPFDPHQSAFGIAAAYSGRKQIPAILILAADPLR